MSGAWLGDGGGGPPPPLFVGNLVTSGSGRGRERQEGWVRRVLSWGVTTGTTALVLYPPVCAVWWVLRIVAAIPKIHRLVVVCCSLALLSVPFWSLAILAMLHHWFWQYFVRVSEELGDLPHLWDMMWVQLGNLRYSLHATSSLKRLGGSGATQAAEAGEGGEEEEAEKEAREVARQMEMQEDRDRVRRRQELKRFLVVLAMGIVWSIFALAWLPLFSSTCISSVSAVMRIWRPHQW